MAKGHGEKEEKKDKEEEKKDPIEEQNKRAYWALGIIVGLLFFVVIGYVVAASGEITQRRNAAEQARQAAVSCESGDMLVQFDQHTQLDALALEYGFLPVGIELPSFDEERSQIVKACAALKKVSNQASKIKDADPTTQEQKVQSLWSDKGIEPMREISQAFGSVSAQLSEPREALEKWLVQAQRFALAQSLPKPERLTELENAQASLSKGLEALNQGEWEEAKLQAALANMSLDSYFRQAPRTPTATWAAPTATASFTPSPP